MRTFAIGDIHGRYDLLKNLLRLLDRYHRLDLNKDLLVFTGDYVDRGPNSLDVLRTIRKLTEKHPDNVIALAGNHEYMMLDYFAGWGKSLWLMNGGLATLDSFKHRRIKKEIEWVKQLPLFYKTDKYFFSHAPVPADKFRAKSRQGVAEFTKEELTWSCPKGFESAFARHHEDGLIGVCGHIHALHRNIFEPRLYDHYIYLDAGCGCHPNAALCAVNLDTREVVYSVDFNYISNAFRDVF